LNTNIFRDRIKLQVKTITQGALGQTVVWKPVDDVPARVVALKAESRVAYQQLNSHVTHKVELRTGVTIALGTNRIIWRTKTLEPVEPPTVAGDRQIVICQENADA
jgi:hypothetical protein